MVHCLCGIGQSQRPQTAVALERQPTGLPLGAWCPLHRSPDGLSGAHGLHPVLHARKGRGQGPLLTPSLLYRVGHVVPSAMSNCLHDLLAPEEFCVSDHDANFSDSASDQKSVSVTSSASTEVSVPRQR